MSSDLLAPACTDDEAVRAQVAYYRARAPEYDDWFYRRGECDRGDRHTRRWRAEVEEVHAELVAARPSGHLLELACDTGLWTERLVPFATSMTAVDASPEVIAINRRRVAPAAVDYRVADLFTWRPDRRYDFVLFGFWISHVPPSRFIAFWNMVARCLTPGGRIFFADSRRHPDSMAADPVLGEPRLTRSRRRLRDGRKFEIVKIFYKPDDLVNQLYALGWTATVHGTKNFFLYGTALTDSANGERLEDRTRKAR